MNRLQDTSPSAGGLPARVPSPSSFAVSHCPLGFRIELGAGERDALLCALELALAVLREDLLGTALLADLDEHALDAMADRLFLAGSPS